MLKLISLDLDGTLLDPKGRITEASKAGYHLSFISLQVLYVAMCE